MELARSLARDLFKIPMDAIPDRSREAYVWVRGVFFDGPWHQTYDVLEYAARNIDVICNRRGAANNYYRDQRYDLIQELNRILEGELSGYRFVRGELVPIADPAEVAAVEQAAAATTRDPLRGAHEHLLSALRFLGQKPSPDYRNSVKESISAVESVVNVLGGGRASGVSEAVEELAKHTEIHGALKAALKQLYGYTSDADGIRHAILDQATVGFDEAKFMLVVCAAFVNFVVGKAQTAGLLR